MVFSRWLVAAAFSVATTSIASAQDWDSFYAGVTGTAGIGGEFWPEERSPGQLRFDSMSGLMAGAQAGYLATHSGIVWGLEVDASIGEIFDEIQNVPIDGESHVTALDWLTTLRGRAGADLGIALPYLTAGLAVGGGRVSTEAYDGETTRVTHVGFAAGAGLELSLSDNISVRGEYLHVHLPAENYYFSEVNQAAGISVDLLRAGLNYRF